MSSGELLRLCNAEEWILITMTGEPRKGRVPREVRQSEILEAAIACVIRSGFRGASMDEIAREANLSVGVIYRYFSSKEAIIEAIVARGFEELQQKIGNNEGLSSEELRHLLIGDIDNFVASQRDRKYAALQLEIYAEAARNPRVETILRNYVEAERELVRQLLRRTLPNPVSAEELTARADILRVLADGLLADGLYTDDNNKAFIDMLGKFMQPLVFDS